MQPLVLALLMLLCACTASSDRIIYEKRERWWPCAPGETCGQSTILYSSGRIVYAGAREDARQLTSEQLKAAEDLLRRMLEKEYGKDYPVDYAATHTIRVDGRAKTITYSSRFGEFEELAKLLEAAEKI